MPFVIDLHLFLGKNLSTSDTHSSYGRFPQQILDYQCDNVANIIQSSVDLTAMKRVVSNASKLYFKTRANPSPESVQRSKEISHPIPIHPIMEKYMTKQDTERFNMVESLKSFRPAQTIMEIRQKNRLTPLQSRVMPGTEGIGKTAVEIMKKKNYIHGGLIAKAKEAKQKKQEEAALKVGEKRKQFDEDQQDDDEQSSSFNKGRPPKKKKRKNDFKDEEFYMTMTKGDEHSERGLSISDNFQKTSQDAVLDLLPDEREKLNSKNNLKWDRKKKKFVGQATKPSSIFGTVTKSSLKVRNESGQLIDKSNSKANL